jgi:hypothetical protein
MENTNDAQTLDTHMQHAFHTHSSFTFGVTGFDVVKQRKARFSSYIKVKPGVR